MDTLANLFISGDIIQALCRTLIHSLWQGIILAVFAGITVLLTKNKSTVLRYNLLTIQFVLFLAVVAGTFYVQWTTKAPDTTAYPALSSGWEPGLENEDGLVAGDRGTTLLPWNIQHYLASFDDFLDRYAFYIVIFWSLMLCWRSVQMIGGMQYLHRIRRQKNQPAAGFWQVKVQHLAERLQIKKAIQLLESELITVPMVVGFFAPVILVPAGLLANLPPVQMEAILLHELAHIRRKDFLFNLLQCFAETVFFFNPAVLWVSVLIRDERENCCDDIAVSMLHNKTHYIRALVAFQEFNLQSSRYAVAFPGRKYTLLDRVKRIIHHQHTKTLSIMEKISLVVSLAIVGAIAFFPACQTFAQNPEVKAVSDLRTINIDGEGTAADPQTIYVKDQKGKTYQYKKIENKITEMYVDHEKVPEEKWADYNWLIKDIDQQIQQDMVQAEADRKQAELDMIQAERDMEQAVIDQEEAMREQEQALKEMEEDMQEAQQEAKEAAEMAAMDQEEAVREMRQAEIERKQAMEEMARDREQAKRDMEQAKRDLEQSKRDVEQAKRDMEQAKRDMELAKTDMKNAEADRKMVKNLLDDAVSDKLAKDHKSILNFKLTDTAFEINGIQQSSEMHKKYKAKYLKTGNFISYDIQHSNSNRRQE